VVRLLLYPFYGILNTEEYEMDILKISLYMSVGALAAIAGGLTIGIVQNLLNKKKRSEMMQSHGLAGTLKQILS
jgi:hypothetical protein